MVRFVAEEDGQIHLGQVDVTAWPDVGLSVFNGDKVNVKVITGSIFDGVVTDKILHISKVGVLEIQGCRFRGTLTSLLCSCYHPFRRNKSQSFAA